MSDGGWVRSGRAQARGDSEEDRGGTGEGYFVCLSAIKACFSVLTFVFFLVHF